MKKLYTLLLILTLGSCLFFQENGIDIIIENKSSETIKNITITTSEKIETIYIDSIQSNKSITKFLSMKKNKTDGGYIISYEINNNKKQLKDGYYTNGGSLNDWIKFAIEKDSTFISYSKSKLLY